ncbi:hypothetical protein [Moritella dasanensis]|uniref:hypothetical protein n=1 Tax=Moritella dasanensis TaxID=428031 RepID=UPI000370AA3E|nr:hypothetical protein [Moritella dasanensis]
MATVKPFQSVQLVWPSRFYMCGHGLIELMMSISLAGIIFTGSSYIYAAHEVQNIRAEQYYLVQQEAQNMLTIMQRELGRAGYKSHIAATNAFIYSDDEIYILNASKDCIVYRYDRNEDGVFNNENFGFRLYLGGLQQRKGSAVSCDGGLGWEMISDTASTDITELQFSVLQQRYSLPYRIKGVVNIVLSIRHRQFADIELHFFRNSSARAFL